MPQGRECVHMTQSMLCSFRFSQFTPFRPVHGPKRVTRQLVPARPSNSLPDPPSTSGESKESPSSSPRFNAVDPVETVAWGGRLPSRRRFVTGLATAAAIVLGGNFGGITSLLLSLDGGNAAHTSRIDILVPVNGYKRSYDPQNGYEFEYPSEWLADQTLYYRYAQRAEQERSLDPPSIRQSKRRNVPEPTAAYGPAGSTGEENVSVIVAPITPGFRLANLGPPEAAAQRFLDTTIAPEGSGLEATLVAASSRSDEAGVLYYTMEYTVKGPKFYRHNVSVYATRSDLLYTLNCQCPQQGWERDAVRLKHAAATFKLTSTGRGGAFPQAL